MSNPRILFVDDEPLMLQGLRNLLWKDKSRWDLVFASGGQEQRYSASIVLMWRAHSTR